MTNEVRELDRADRELHELLDEYLGAATEGELLTAIRVIRELIAAAIFRQSDLLDDAGDAGFGWDDISAAVGADADRNAPQVLYTFGSPLDRRPRNWKGPGAERGGLRAVPPECP